MLRVDTYIEIGNYQFDFTAGVEVNSSWRDLVSTAAITMPRKLLTEKNQLLQDVVKGGGKVTIQLGYNDNLNGIFTGYVQHIDAKTPVVIHCEDEMYIHKATKVVPRAWKSAAIADVLAHLSISQYNSFGSLELGAFVISDKEKNQAAVFDKLRKQYGLFVFYRRGVLHVGKPYDPVTSIVHDFNFNYNIIDHDLEYRRKEDVKILVKAISTYDDGSKVTVELGDSDGETHTLNYYALSKSALEQQASAEMDKLKYDGYKGSITTFGEPMVVHGDVVSLTNEEYPERSGRFLVDAVTTTMTVSGGYRQEIKLGYKL